MNQALGSPKVEPGDKLTKVLPQASPTLARHPERKSQPCKALERKQSQRKSCHAEVGAEKFDW